MASDYVAGAVPVRRRGPGVAFWGMAMLVAGEATLFGTFIGSYYYLRFESVHWPPPGTPEPRVAVPLIMVGILVSSSIPMQLAARAVRRSRLWTTRLLLVSMLLLAIGVSTDFFVISSLIVSDARVPPTLSILLFAALITLWFVFPRAKRQRSGRLAPK